MASQVASAINIWLRLHEEWSCSNYPNPSFQPLTRLRTSTCFIRQVLEILGRNFVGRLLFSVQSELVLFYEYTLGTSERLFRQMHHS